MPIQHELRFDRSDAMRDRSIIATASSKIENMTFAAAGHFVFVDFENVPGIDLSPIESHSARVTLLIGKNQKKIDLALVQQIHRFGERVTLIEVGASGHNALDLTLAYYLGQAVQQSPQSKFYIISKDSDFDALIIHLRLKGVAVERYGAFTSLPFIEVAKLPAQTGAAAKPTEESAKPKQTETRSSELIARLTNPTKGSRPATEKALRAHIKTALGKDAAEDRIEYVMTHLKENGLSISIGGKLQWPASTQS